MIFIKIHRSSRTIVSVCDADLIGKKVEEGNKQLDIRENFYRGEENSYDEAVEVIRFQAQEDATFNIVGKESIKAAIEAGIITKAGVGHVNGIPYALVLL